MTPLAREKGKKREKEVLSRGGVVSRHGGGRLCRTGEIAEAIRCERSATVYEAGPTGYWLHDALTEAGFDSIITPPSVDTDPWHGNLSR